MEEGSIIKSYQVLQREYNKNLSRVVNRMAVDGGATRISHRKWWNPVRWFRGEIKVKYIPMERMIKK